MKTMLTATALVLSLFAGQALAANAQCVAKADAKGLKDKHRSDYIKNCEKNPPKAAAPKMSAADCEKSAADKKLTGAAASSHIKKCMAQTKKA